MRKILLNYLWRKKMDNNVWDDEKIAGFIYPIIPDPNMKWLGSDESGRFKIAALKVAKFIRIACCENPNRPNILWDVVVETLKSNNIRGPKLCMFYDERAGSDADNAVNLLLGGLND
jgi:hypothetical protein